MIKKITLILTVSLIFIAGSSAQKTLLKGTLVSKENKNPLAFATLSVFKTTDSTNIKNAVTEVDGTFQVEISQGNYYILFQYLGYQNLIVPNVILTESTVDLGNLEMLEDGVSLDVIEVSAEKSVMQLKLDKRVFNVGKDLTNAGNSAADILNNVPSVTVDPEGNIRLRGSQSVRILVDGKPSAMLSAGDVAALQRMQGDIIESIEVITNPSARYEAEGEAGIINIILKKNKKKGINGSFGGNVGYPDNYGASYSLNYRQENFNFFSNFGISYRKTPGGGNSTQRFFDNGSLTDFFTSETNQLRGGIGGNFQFGTDWYITDKDVLTGSLLYRQSRDENTASVIYNDFDENENLLNSTIRDNVEISNNRNVEAALNYKKTFAQKDREWTVDFKYILDDDLELTDYEQFSNLTSMPVIQQSSNTEYENNTLFQTDYIHPFNDSTRIEGGLRATFRTIRNAFLVEEENAEGIFEPLENFDDELVYTENISAVYLIGATQLGKFGILGGLRAELSDVTAALLKSEVTNEQYYLNLFPSLSVSYQFSQKNQVQLSYSRRLSRPYFRLLLPFSNFTDPRSNRVGNPNLFPEFTNSYEISVLRYLNKGSFLASVYHRYTTGVIERIILPADDGTSIQYPINLSDRSAFGVEMNFSYDLTSWWSINSDFNLYQATVGGRFEGIDYSAEIFSWNSRLTSKVKIAKKVELQTTFDYQAPENNTQGRTLALYSFDFGASVDVLAGKGTLTLSGRDIFNTRIQRRVIDLPNYKAESAFQWRRSQQIVLSFVYRLNQEKNRKDFKSEERE